LSEDEDQEVATAHANNELLQQSFDAFSKGDMEAVAATMADDVVFHFPGRGPLAGDHRGKDQVLATLAQQAELSGGTFRVEVHDILANDEHGAVLIAASAERGEKAWADNAVLIFHIRDGKISEVWLHPGDQYAGDEFFS
jgi:ketosteroid isomerase-like protein